MRVWWTPEQEHQLTQLWDLGWSGTDIASVMGIDRDRALRKARHMRLAPRAHKHPAVMAMHAAHRQRRAVYFGYDMKNFGLHICGGTHG